MSNNNQISTAPKPGTDEFVDSGLAVLSALCNDPESPVQTPLRGWSVEDLAKIIGCSAATISRRTNRAMTKLRLRLPKDILQDLKSN